MLSWLRDENVKVKRPWPRPQRRGSAARVEGLGIAQKAARYAGKPASGRARSGPGIIALDDQGRPPDSHSAFPSCEIVIPILIIPNDLNPVY